MLWNLSVNVLSNQSVYSYSASISGGNEDELEELNSSSSSNMNQLKRWFLSHAQYLNFFSILLLASVSFHHFVCLLALLFNLIIQETKRVGRVMR